MATPFRIGLNRYATRLVKRRTRFTFGRRPSAQWEASNFRCRKANLSQPFHSRRAKPKLPRNLAVGRELNWVQGLDLNQRPSGYEPDELPGCSTLQQRGGATCVAPHCLSTPFWFFAHFALARGRGDPCFGPLCQLVIINHNLSPDR